MPQVGVVDGHDPGECPWLDPYEQVRVPAGVSLGGRNGLLELHHGQSTASDGA